MTLQGSFTEVELGFTDAAGLEEAMRCMGCDLRFTVGRTVAQPQASAAKAKQAIFMANSQIRPSSPFNLNRSRAVTQIPGALPVPTIGP